MPILAVSLVGGAVDAAIGRPDWSPVYFGRKIRVGRGEVAGMAPRESGGATTPNALSPQGLVAEEL